MANDKQGKKNNNAKVNKRETKERDNRFLDKKNTNKQPDRLNGFGTNKEEKTYEVFMSKVTSKEINTIQKWMFLLKELNKNDFTLWKPKEIGMAYEELLNGLDEIRINEKEQLSRYTLENFVEVINKNFSASTYEIIQEINNPKLRERVLKVYTYTNEQFKGTFISDMEHIDAWCAYKKLTEEEAKKLQHTAITFNVLEEVNKYSNLKNQLKGYGIDIDKGEEVQEELVEEVREEIQEELVEEVREEIQEELVEEVREEIQEELVEEIREEIQEEPVEEVREEIQEELVEEVCEEIQEELVEEIREEIQEEPVEEVREEIQEELVEEVREEIQEELVEEVREEIQEEPVEEVREEIQEELVGEVCEEIEEEPVEEVCEEIQEELVEEVREEIQEKLRYLYEELEATKLKSRQLEKNNSLLKQEKIVLMNRYARVENENDELKKQIVSAQESVEELYQANNKMKEENVSLTKEKEKILAELEEIKESNITLATMLDKGDQFKEKAYKKRLASKLKLEYDQFADIKAVIEEGVSDEEAQDMMTILYTSLGEIWNILEKNDIEF